MLWRDRIFHAPEGTGGGAAAPVLGDGGAAGAGAGTGAAVGQGVAGAADDWSTTLDDGAKALIKTKGWAGKPLGEVAPQILKSYGELEGLVGGSLKPPAADAKPEDWQAFYRKLGAPESPDKYVIPKPASGEYSEADKQFQASVLPILAEAGLSQRQLDAIAPKWNAIAQAQVQALDQNAIRVHESTLAELRTEWGGDQGFATNMDLANRALKTVFGDQTPAVVGLRLADGSFLGDNPVLAKAFAKFGKQMSEDGTLVSADASGGQGGGGAKAQMDALYKAAAADPKHPLNDQAHPEHKAVSERVMRLAIQMAEEQSR